MRKKTSTTTPTSVEDSLRVYTRKEIAAKLPPQRLSCHSLWHPVTLGQKFLEVCKFASEYSISIVSIVNQSCQDLTLNSPVSMYP